MNKKIISLIVVFVMIFLSTTNLLVVEAQTILSSQVYKISSAKIENISPDTMVNTFLYNIAKDNPDYTFCVTTQSGNAVAYNKTVKSGMILKATDPNQFETSYTLAVSGIYAVEDDFEKYPTGYFSANSIWSTSNQNASAKIVNENNNRFYTVSVPTDTASGESYIETYQKGISGKTIIKMKLYNKAPENGSIQVYLRDNVNNATNGVFYLFNLSTDKLTCLSNSNKTEVECDDSTWLDMWVIINENDKSIKIYNGNSEVASLSDYTKHQTSFDWSNFKIRIVSKIKNTAASDACMWLDDFSYIADYTDSKGISYDDVNIYQNGEYTGGIHIGENTLSVPINNNTQNSEDIVLVAARKKGLELVKAFSSNHTLAPGKSYLPLELEADSSAGSIYELYVWNKKGLVPLGLKQRLQKNKTALVSSNSHPRLIADIQTFNNIIASSNEDKISAVKTITDYADKIVSGFTISGSYSSNEFYVGKYDDNFLDMSKRVKKFSLVLSMAYRLTNNKDYSDTLVKVLYAAGGLDNWNPSHYLDVAEMTAAFAIGYDWCYDALSQKEKEDISSFVFEKSLGNALLYYDGTKGLVDWTYSNMNWNAVVNSSVMMAAIAFADVNPNLCERLILYAEKSLKNVLAEFAPDGGWHEGIAYLKYSLTYLTELSSTLKLNFGNDTLISPASGYEKIADFLMNTYGPDGYHNYADMSESFVAPPEMFYIAGEFDRSDVHTFALENVSKTSPEILVYSLLWCNDNIPETNLSNKNTYSRNIEHISFSKEADGKLAWLSAIGGNNSFNHSHMDLGSFVYDYDGVRWAIDLGTEEYYDDYFDIYSGLSAGRWKYYRTRAESHNTLVINPSANAGQLDTADAYVTKYNLRYDNPYAIYNLSSAYSDNAQAVKRGFMMLNSGGAVIRDEITLANDNPVYWFMHTDAQVVLSSDNKKATLTKEGKSVDVILYEENLEFSIKDAKPLSQIGEYTGSDYPVPSKQNSNSGIKKLMVKTTGTTNITVCITPSGGGLTKACDSLDNWN